VAWNLTAFSLVAFLSAGLFAVLVAVGVRRRWTPSTRAFVALMAGGFAWTTVYGIQLGFTTEAAQVAWFRATLVSSALIPPALLVFSLRYSGYGHWMTRRRAVLIGLELATFAAFTVTNPWHELVWTAARLPPKAISPALDVTFGPVYYAHITVAYLAVLVGIGVLLTVFFRRESVSHNQAGLLVLGSGPALLTHALYTLGLSPRPGLDLTPFVFVATGILFGLALFYFDLLERMPVAHRRALEIMGDGLLVVDESGRYVDANTVARRVFDIPDEPGTNARQRSLLDQAGVDDITELDSVTRTMVDDGLRRAYDVHVSELADQHDDVTGHAVVLRDVTDRFAYEERLEVTNRVLRHNLRNDMNVVEGYAALLEDHATTPEDEAYAETIRETAEDLIELSVKAREMISIEERRTPNETPADAARIVTELVEDLRAVHPDVDITADVGDDARVATTSHRALRLAIRNLLENAVRHNTNPNPRLDVVVERIADRVHVLVTDNGPGLPENERDVLRDGTETPVQHGQGLGLWLTYWIVDSTGGEIDIESTAGGTSISVLLEAATADEPPRGSETEP